MKHKDFHILTPFEVKAATTPPHDPNMVSTGDSEVIKISGYANFSGLVEAGDVFIDLVGDVVVPSGIDVSVWRKNPQILLHHDRHCTIGRGLQVTKKKDGLFIECELHAGAMEEEDFYRIKSGLLSYFSIGFRTIAGEFKKVDDRQVYFITKSLLLEVSVVGIPCNGESAFRLVKALPDDGGFYAGDLAAPQEEKNFSPQVENESHNQNQGESTMIKAKRRELLPEDKVKELEALGLTAELDAEKELSFAELKELIKNEIKAELKAEAEALAEAAQEEAEKAAAEAAEKEANELEEKAAAEAEALAKEEAETTEAFKALQESLAEIKKELGNE